MANTETMIVFENVLEEMFLCLPPMRYDSDSVNLFDVTFGYGTDKQLNAFLKQKHKGGTCYPLVWLLYPYEELHRINKVEIEKAVLIISVGTRSSMQNKERIKTTYQNILIPLFDNIVKLMRLSNNVNVSGDYKMVKYPNYSNNNGEGTNHAGSFIWDAMKITFDITVLNTCFRKVVI